MTKIPPIIVIDDDRTMRRACQAALERRGYDVETFADGPSGLERIREIHPALVVVDLKMPGMGGMEVIEHVKGIDPDIVVIVITGYATISTAVEAMKAGAYDFLPKPFTADELRVIIGRALERQQLAMEAGRLRQEKEDQARRFVTFVSHQLQSPLGAVRQNLDTLLHLMGHDASAQHRSWIERSSAKVAQMSDTIRDWLHLARVDSGQLAAEREPFQWQDLLPTVFDSVEHAAQEKEIRLDNQVPGDLPQVLGDASAAQMLLQNLVMNGIKYSHRGGQVKVTGRSDGDTVTLEIEDRGIGLLPEDQEKVFDEFFRVVSSETDGIAGTGLGLAICRRIARELGGDVTVESEPGEGSVFAVVLPLAPEQASDLQT